MRSVLFAALLLLARSEEAAEEAAEKPEGEGKSRKELAEGHSFCQHDDCYALLGVSETSKLPAIKRAYHRLAAEWHPDRCKSGNVAQCRELFPKYANAYEVLSNTEMRKNYDYVMANPFEFPAFYMRYSRAKYAPKSDMRLVLLMTVLGAAAIQYHLKKATYDQAVSQMKKDPRSFYQMRLKELLAAAGGGASSNTSKHKTGGLKGEALEKKRKEIEAAVEIELAAELPPPPAFSDTVAMDFLKLPLTFSYAALWFLKFTVLRQAYGPAEQATLTAKALGVSAAEFAGYSDQDQAEYAGAHPEPPTADGTSGTAPLGRQAHGALWLCARAEDGGRPSAGTSSSSCGWQRTSPSSTRRRQAGSGRARIRRSARRGRRRRTRRRPTWATTESRWPLFCVVQHDDVYGTAGPLRAGSLG